MSEFEQLLASKIAEVKQPSKINQKSQLSDVETKQTPKQKLIDDYFNVHEKYLERFDPDNAKLFKQQLEDDYDSMVKLESKNKMSDIRDKLAQEYAKLQNTPPEQEIQHSSDILYNFSMVMIKLIERSADELTEEDPLNGLYDDFKQVEEEAKPLFAEIYGEYAHEINQYLTPGRKLAMLYGPIIINRVALNKLKKQKKINNNIKDVKKSNDRNTSH